MPWITAIVLVLLLTKPNWTLSINSKANEISKQGFEPIANGASQQLQTSQQESIDAVASNSSAFIVCLCNDHRNCKKDPKFDTNSSICVSRGVEHACYTSKELVTLVGPPNSNHYDGESSDQFAPSSINATNPLYSTSIKVVRVAYGCVSSYSNTFRCQGGATAEYDPDRPRGIACCNSSLCNAALDPPLRSRARPTATSRNKVDRRHGMDVFSQMSLLQLCLLSLACVAFVVVAVLLLVICLWPRFRHKQPCGALDRSNVLGSTASGHKGNDCQERQLLTSSGSGGGAPSLTQSTIARQLRLVALLGQGRFGQVWRGEWRGEAIAVKLFAAEHEVVWLREAQLQQVCLLRHENVLGFVAADVLTSTAGSNAGQVMRLLITELQPLGSLRHFLRANRASLTPFDALQLALSCSSGLCYLHTEIAGSQGKLALAHRNLSSNNILVRKDACSVCISDLGLAFLSSKSVTINGADPRRRLLDESFNLSCSPRYAAPELFFGELNRSSTEPSIALEQWCRADVYAFGLVMWEMATAASGNVCLPFEEWLPNSLSSTEECASANWSILKAIVADQGIRPSLPLKDTDSLDHLSGLWNVICECWHQKAESRITVLRAKKNLVRLLSSRATDFATKKMFTDEI